MLNLDFISDFVHEHFSGVKISKNGTHFNARCAICGDSNKNPNKRRFNLDYNDGSPIYHCFNCNSSGGFLKLYCLMTGIDEEDAKKELYGYNPEEVKKRMGRKKKKIIKNPHLIKKHNYILKDCFQIEKPETGIIYQKYIEILKEFKEKRKIPKESKIFIAYKGFYKSRIIIPIFDSKDNIIYFQARRIPGTNIEPKYINPSLKKSIIILNKNNFDPEKYIIIVEGLLDAFSIGTQGTTCLGASIDDDFIKKVLKYTKKGVIISFDRDDAGFEALNKFLKESEYNKKSKYFVIPNKYKDCDDINKFKVTYNIEDMYNFIVENSTSYFKMMTLGKL